MTAAEREAFLADVHVGMLGAEFGDLYLAATTDDAADSVDFRMVPERWRTTDFGKQFA
jgi:hypothetical protein